MTKRPEEDRLLSRYIIISKISFVMLFCRNLFPLIPPAHFTHLGAPNLSRLKKIRLCLARHSYFLPSLSDFSVDESEDVTDDLKFACEPPCPAKSKTRYHLVRHKSGTTCFHKLPFVCDLCGKRYRTEESKASHFSKGRCVKATES